MRGLGAGRCEKAAPRQKQTPGGGFDEILVQLEHPAQYWLPVLKKFTSMSPQEQTNVGDGVKIVGRWHYVAARSGVVIFESNDPAAVQRYLGLWNPHMEIDARSR